MICRNCANKTNDALIYETKFDIVNILKYFMKTPLSGFEKIALDEVAAKALQDILRAYMSYYLGVPIKKGLFRSPLRNDQHSTCSFFRG